MTPERRVIATLALSLLAACGGADDQTSTASAAAETPKAATDSVVMPPAAPAAIVDTSAQKPETGVLRETFAYGGGTRDPFQSLLAQKTSGPELVDLQLVAVYQDVRYAGNSVAVFRDRRTSKRYKLRTGEQLGRLRVAQIRDKDVVFTIEDFGFERQETLSLRKPEEEMTQ